MKKAKTQIENDEEIITLDEFIKNISLTQTEEPSIAKTIETVINQYFDHKDIREKTELSREEILILCRLTVFHKILSYYGVKDSTIPVFIDNYLHYLVSKERKGRREIVEILSSFATAKREEEDNLTTVQKLFERIK